MRRNADLFVMLTTMNLTTLDHVYKEFASIDYANFQHFVGNMLKYTEDWGTYIIDNSDPNARGRDRFFHYTAKKPEDLPTFTMFAPRAWGPNKQFVVEQQRATHKRVPKYSENYMRQLKYAEKTRITSEQVRGDTEEKKKHEDKDPFSMLLRGV